MMKIENKTIVIISPDLWNALPVSKHHYAKELAKTNKVYFINPPNNDKDFKVEKLSIINEYKKVKGLRFFPKFLRKLFMKREVYSIINKIENNQVDIIWSFDTSRLYYLDLFKSKLKIAHIVDLSENFYFKELVQNADYCFGISDAIINKMKIFNSRCFKIRHGYFLSENVGFIINNHQKKCLYIGNLTIKYLDWEAIYKLIKHRSDVLFSFIGTKSGTLDKNQELFYKKALTAKNSIFKAEVKPEDVINEMLNSDFCLLAYQSKKYPKQLEDSHKIMQYLGSGKPVFASYTHEYKDTDLIFMYNDVETIEESFDAFLNNQNNHFSEESRQKRINFALDNTYPKQIERIAQIIQNNK